MRLPACEISLAPTNSPNIIVKFGAIAFILFLRYSDKLSLYSAINNIIKPNSVTYVAKLLIYFSSVSLISVPIEISAASLTSFSISSVKISDKSSF